MTDYEQHHFDANGKCFCGAEELTPDGSMQPAPEFVPPGTLPDPAAEAYGKKVRRRCVSHETDGTLAQAVEEIQSHIPKLPVEKLRKFAAILMRLVREATVAKDREYTELAEAVAWIYYQDDIDGWSHEALVKQAGDARAEDAAAEGAAELQDASFEIIGRMEREAKQTKVALERAEAALAEARKVLTVVASCDACVDCIEDARRALAGTEANQGENDAYTR